MTPTKMSTQSPTTDSSTESISPPTQASEDHYLPGFEKLRKSNELVIRIVSEGEFATACTRFGNHAEPGESAQEHFMARYHEMTAKIQSLLENEHRNITSNPHDIWRSCFQHKTLLGLAEIALVYIEQLATHNRQAKIEQISSTISSSPRRSARINNYVSLDKVSKPKKQIPRSNNSNGKPGSKKRTLRSDRKVDRKTLASIVRPILC